MKLDETEEESTEGCSLVVAAMQPTELWSLTLDHGFLQVQSK